MRELWLVFLIVLCITGCAKNPPNEVTVKMPDKVSSIQDTEVQVYTSEGNNEDDISIEKPNTITSENQEILNNSSEFSSTLNETLIDNDIKNVTEIDNGGFIIWKTNGDVIELLADNSEVNYGNITDDVLIEQGWEDIKVEAFLKHNDNIVLCGRHSMTILDQQNEIVSIHNSLDIRIDLRMNKIYVSVDNEKNHVFNWEDMSFSTIEFVREAKKVDSFQHAGITYIDTLHSDKIQQNEHLYAGIGPFEIIKGYKFIDIKNNKFGMLAGSQNIVMIDTNKIILLIDEPVREFAASKKGILYCDYNKLTNVKYLDLEKNEIYTLDDISDVDNVALDEEFAYLVKGEIVYKRNLDDIINGIDKAVEMNYITESGLDESNSIFRNIDNLNIIKRDKLTFLLIETDGTNVIIDTDRFEVYDSFNGKNTIIDREGLIFYNYESFVVRYNIQYKSSEIIAFDTYPYQLYDINTEILFSIAYDADPKYNIVDKGVNLFSDVTADYVLLLSNDHGPMGFSVYDVKSKKILPGVMGSSLEYKYEPEGIKYKYKKNHLSEMSNWLLYELKEGYSIIDSDSIIFE